MDTQVAIVGAGLTGLSVAASLHAAGVPFRLIEARDRLGGRIRTEGLGGGSFDLGPSWFWPGQPRMAALTKALGLTVFEQYAHGALLFETERGEVLRDRGISSMQGSLRIQGGMGALVSGLADKLPTHSIETGRPVVSVAQDGTLGFNDGGTVSARCVVVALPPRVAADLHFTPALTTQMMDALQTIPTWMAGHAKFVAVYDDPFWRKDGLSGDVMSRAGPMVEIHDATSDAHGALFGFLGVPAPIRAGRETEVTSACLAQLERLFGSDAASPIGTFYADWACEPETAAARDMEPLRQHPDYGRPAVLRGTDADSVFFASTELAPKMGGFLEGALASAEDAVTWVMGKLAN